jgi:hypothetical protein
VRIISSLEKTMKLSRNTVPAAVLCVAALLFVAVPAYAYIDPNAAGLLSQIITPLLVVAAAGLTFFRRRLADLAAGISRRFRRGADV